MLTRIALILLLTGSLCCAQKNEKSKPFPAIRNTEKSKERWWSPREAADAIRVPKGFRVTLAAHEPFVRQPIAMTTDERGRLWVAENYTYSDRSDDFDLTLRDRLLILEDEDGDGRFEKRKVFWDQGKRLTSVEVGFGGVWVLCAPQLLFIPDANGDDVPDGEPQVIVNGWNGTAVRHNIVNGLRWGPDGWLYGRHGILATSFVGPPGSPRSQRTPVNVGIWRIHPVTRSFEVVATGTTNPWGLDFDDHGQLFFINTVIGHLWHVAPGAHFKRMFGVETNPHLYELIDQSADHYHWDRREKWSDIRQGVTDSTMKFGGGHAHSGMMIYLADNWPAKYRNTMFTLNLHGRRVNHDRLERQAGGYVGKHSHDFMSTNDPWFRGIELIYGSDGGVYIADWCDVGECHENDGIHRTSGRIYKVTYGKTRRTAKVDLGKQTSAQLASLQTHSNDWFVRQARRLLHQRAAEGQDMKAARSALLKTYQSAKDVRHRLRAMWCLYVTKSVDQDWILEQLSDENEHIRLWAVKFATDGTPAKSAASLLTRTAAKESSPLVRLFLASALQRLPQEQRLPLAAHLCRHEEDAADRAIPLMIWYGIEPVVPRLPEEAVTLAVESKIPLIRRYIARRLTDQLDSQAPAVNKLLASLAANRSVDYQQDVLAGMREATRGWRQATPPSGWKSVSKQLASQGSSEVRDLVRDLAVVFGDGQTMANLQKVAFDTEGDPTFRRSALQALIRNRYQPVMSRLPNLVNDRVLGTDAIRGLSYAEVAQAPKLILRSYGSLTADARAEAISTLASRPSYARELLKAVKDGAVERSAITAFHARQMRSFADPEIDKTLTRVWGSVRQTSADKVKRIEQLKKLLGDDFLRGADHRNGKRLFKESCAKCHTLFGEGAKVGPDLTGANRTNLSYLLENIVDPSATMVDDFKVSVIRLEDGRIVTGVVLQKTKRTVTIQTQKEQMIVPAKEIAAMKQQPQSLMPDGLLKQLSKEQIRDLIGFISGRR